MKKTVRFLKKQEYWLVILGIGGWMLLLNCLTPLASDDYQYTFIYETTRPLNSLWDVLYSQFVHYMNWGGRTVAFLFVQFFLWIGKGYFNIANTFVFVWMLYLVSKICTTKKSAQAIAIAFFLCWTFLPTPGSTIFWVTGACVYMWVTTIVLVFVFRYYKAYSLEENLSERPGTLGSGTKNKKVFDIVVWFFTGIAAGWSNENISVTGIVIAVLFTMAYYCKQKSVLRWQISGIVGQVIGMGFLLLSPGTRYRSSLVPKEGSFLTRLYLGFSNANEKLFNTAADSWVKWLVLGFLIAWAMVLFSKCAKEVKISASIWGIAVFVCNYAMIVSPTYPDRAAFGVYLFCIIGIMYCGNRLLDYYETCNKELLCRVFLFGSCVWFVFSGVEVGYDLLFTYRKNLQREEIVLQEKEMGNSEITVPAMTSRTKYNVYHDVNDWPYYNVNDYYGVESIRLDE